MRGTLTFDQYNDVIYVKVDHDLHGHFHKVCVREGLVQESQADDAASHSSVPALNMNALVQLFSPLVTSQRIMLNQFNNPYTAVHSQDGVIMTFAEYLGFLFVAIGSEGEESLAVIQRRLHIFVRLVKLVCGPAVNTLKASYPGAAERQKLVGKLLDTWETFRKEELAFLLEAVERLLVNQYLNSTCVQLLENVLEKLRCSGHNMNASHAFLLVNTKLLALYSSRNACELIASDILALTMVAHMHHPNCRFELPRSPRRTSPVPHSPSQQSNRSPSPSASPSTLQVPKLSFTYEEDKFEFKEQSEESGQEQGHQLKTSLATDNTRLRVPVTSESEESSDSDAFYSPCGTPPKHKLLEQAFRKLSVDAEINKHADREVDSVTEGDEMLLNELACDDYTQDMLFLHTPACPLSPHLVNTVKVMEGVVLVVLCDVGKSSLAGAAVQSLDILHSSQIFKQPEHGKQLMDILETSVKRLSDAVKRMKNPPPGMERYSRNLLSRWDMVKKNGLSEFLKSSSVRYMVSRLESCVSSLMEAFREGFQHFCLPDVSANITLTLEATNTLVDVQALLMFGLADYADYLKIKALRNVTITSYINEFPGMVHFIYVNRTSNQVIVPTMDDGSAMRLNNTNLSALIKEKVNQMVEFTRMQLQLGHFAIVWRDSHFHYSYFLWFEDLKGDSLKPQVLLHGLRNFPPPGILSGDFYKMLRHECFPSLSTDDIHCYELLCIHLATASPPFIVEHVRRLAATVWDLCGAAQSPVDLL